ncbi:MAG: bifunctional serine/threonine-protein kinase/formylglycine-generating enzyme family protein, partial [Thermoanaerobaculia bacterium]
VINETLSHYRVIKKIGAGGMGEVYLAQETRLDRKVALKVLPPALEKDEMARSRFLREAKSAAALDHPYVCHIHEIGSHAGRDFIAMEYVEGQTLGERLKSGPMAAEEILGLAVEIAEALDKAHSESIVHRDLKPANIMITTGGHAKVMDFGLAKRIDAGDPDTQEITLTQLTREGSTIGTVPYMSPEQIRAEDVDLRSDMFSLGTIFYEMLTGVHPFIRNNAMDTASAILRDVVPPLSEARSKQVAEFQPILDKMLAKNREERYQSAGEVLSDLRRLTRRRAERTAPASFLRALRRPKIAVPAALLAAILVVSGWWYFKRQAKIRWAQEEALPEIERLVEASWRDYTAAYELALEAERYIPDDPRLAELFAESSLEITIETEPSGADVYMKRYANPESKWTYLGTTPLEDTRLPIGIFRWKFEKEGFDTVAAAAATFDVDPVEGKLLHPGSLTRALDKLDDVPWGVVRVRGGDTRAGKVDDFYIDRFEVTNLQFKKFVVAGGYRNRENWKHEFTNRGKILSWEEAMAAMVDSTARPGPATWQAGDYVEGEGDHPVGGISWYEAAAFAEFSGKSLPTASHWGLARGEATTMIQVPQLGGYAIFAPFSNFGGKGSVPVGDLQGITSFGAYDMAGNVREWCWNATEKGRLIRGGSWNDATYMFSNLSQAPAMDRSPQNGFRTTFYPAGEEIVDSVLELSTVIASRDLSAETPVADSIFQDYREQYSYDEIDLNEKVEWRRESPGEWIHEKITYDAAYGDERIIAHLFLPENAAPPYQTVIYFPGSGSLFQPSSEAIEDYWEFPIFLQFVVKSGRAVLYPVYQGTFERAQPGLAAIHFGDTSLRYVEFNLQLIQDFKRSLDFLETRPDIDA